MARQAGIARLEAEARLLGVPLSRPALIAQEVTRDLQRAKRIAGAFAERWLGVAKAAEAKHPHLAAAAANNGTAARLKSVAVTENAEAFNTGRRATAKRLPLGILRVWDATLDKRTCPICERADGTIVGAREHFPLGEPGAVHPNCRCTDSLLTSDEDANGILIKPAPLRLVPS